MDFAQIHNQIKACNQWGRTSLILYFSNVNYEWLLKLAELDNSSLFRKIERFEIENVKNIEVNVKESNTACRMLINWEKDQPKSTEIERSKLEEFVRSQELRVKSIRNSANDPDNMDLVSRISIDTIEKIVAEMKANFDL